MAETAPILDQTDPEARDHVNRVVAASGTSFMAGMKVLPPPRRAAMFAIYAFCREIDDIADEPAPEADKRRRLDAWRAEIDRLYDGRPEAPTARALLGPVRAFALAKEDFLALIEGMEMDAADTVRLADLGRARILLRPRRLRGRPPVGQGVRRAGRGRRRRRLCARPGAAAHQHPARPRAKTPSAAGSICRPICSSVTASRRATRTWCCADPALPHLCDELAGLARRRFHEAAAAIGARSAPGAASRDHHDARLSPHPRSPRGARLDAARSAGLARQDREAVDRAALRPALARHGQRSTSSAPASPASPRRSSWPRPDARSSCYEAAGQAGGRCRSFHDDALGCEIDNGNHLMLSGNDSAMAYLATIGARDTLLCPPGARFPFVDLATGQRWIVDVNEGRLPWWILAPSRRVADSRPAPISRGAAPRDRRTGAHRRRLLRHAAADLPALLGAAHRRHPQHRGRGGVGAAPLARVRRDGRPRRRRLAPVHRPRRIVAQPDPTGACLPRTT